LLDQIRGSFTMGLLSRPVSIVRTACFAFAVSMMIAGCGTKSSEPPTASSISSSPVVATNGAFDKQILIDFVDNVVIPNNNLFATRAKELEAALDAFTKAPSDATLKAAQTAWTSARAAWEQTECFTFGPATSAGYDGALDAWPVNETDFKAMLAGTASLTAANVSKMKETEKGFHVIEYFLFGNDKSRKPVDLKPRDLEYVKLLGEDFAAVAHDLATSWTKGLDGKPAYREVLVTAGQNGNATYPTVEAAAGEMIQGMLDSLDEVAAEKMGEPLEKKDPKLAESRFSLETLTDMKSNIKGAQNVYLGSFPDANTSGKGLSAYVAQAKPEVDAEVKEQFKAAMDAMDKIPDPFEKAILDPKAEESIKAAVSAITAVRETIEKEVKPLVVQG
jgi:uncharacterized iron-regulated protein